MSIPKVNQIIEIDGISYHFTEHPAAPGMVYGQEGRQAVVYQLRGEDSGFRALKVFKPEYRLPALVKLSAQLEGFADNPGLSVCRRIILTPQKQRHLLQQYPEVLYAVLMPWIEGDTWYDVLAEKQPLTAEQSLALSQSFLNILVNMEQNGLAHCDLSAPNVMVADIPNVPAVHLVDVEQLYGPGLDRPAFVPSGSDGYAHQQAKEGLWQPEADRFAGGILLAEMLGWCDERVRESAWGESYFAPDEVQQDCPRYQTLLMVLEQQWGGKVAGLLTKVWHSNNLPKCPTFGDWLVTLPEQAVAQFGKPVDVKLLLLRASKLERQGDQSESLAAYEEALAHTSPDDALHTELTEIIADLIDKVASESPLEQEAVGLMQAGRWLEAASLYKALLAQATSQDQRQKWETKLAHCVEEGELARLFDDGLAAFERQDWSAARELLTAVVTRRPEYTRQGQLAADLLVRIPGQPEPAPRPRWPIWAAGMVAIVVIAMFFLLGAANGRFALFAQAATETPAITLTSTRVVTTPTLAIQTVTPTLETLATAATPSNTPEPAVTHTATPARTITPTPSATASSTATPAATNTNAPVVVAPLLLIAPQHGTYQNPFTFEWQSSPNESCQVRLRNVGSGHEITSDWLQASSWTIDLPGEQFGNWEWQVVTGNGRVSELGTFVFDPFPNTPRGVLVGDLNGDCVVDEADYQILLDNWTGSFVTPVPGCAGVADLDCDGRVSASDYNLLIINWGKTCDDI